MTGYGRPKVLRELDPGRVNWLWKAAAGAAGWRGSEIVAACREAGIPITLRRVKAWSYGEDNPDFCAMNLAEFEQVLAALQALRRAQKARLAPST